MHVIPHSSNLSIGARWSSEGYPLCISKIGIRFSVLLTQTAHLAIFQKKNFNKNFQSEKNIDNQSPQKLPYLLCVTHVRESNPPKICILPRDTLVITLI